MLYLNVLYQFENEEAQEDFYEELYANNIPEIFRSEKGNLQYDYYFPEDCATELLLIEKWADADSLTAHSESETMKCLTEIKNRLVKKVTVRKFEIEM